LAVVVRARQKVVLSELANKAGEEIMIKTIARKKRVVRRDWTRADVKELRQHSRDKTRVKTISRALKRTPGSLRQKARALGIPLGHRRTKKKRA
jgi:hypothetical protein